MAGLKNGDDYRDGERFRIPALLQLICLGVGGGGALLFFILRFAHLRFTAPIRFGSE